MIAYLLAQLVEALEQLLDDGRCQPSNGSIEQDDTSNVARQSAGNCHHLLLAAGQVIRRHIDAPRGAENSRESRQIPTHANAGLALEPAEFEVVSHGHACKQAATLRHITDAEASDAGRRLADELVAGELD